MGSAVQEAGRAAAAGAASPKATRRRLTQAVAASLEMQGGIQGAASCKDDEPVVITVRSAAAWQEAEIRAASRKAGTTLVWTAGEEADTSVLVETSRGPVMAQARVLRIGDDAPAQVQWQASGEINDDKAEEVSLTTLRLTVVREFATEIGIAEEQSACAPSAFVAR